MVKPASVVVLVTLCMVYVEALATPVQVSRTVSVVAEATVAVTVNPVGVVGKEKLTVTVFEGADCVGPLTATTL